MISADDPAFLQRQALQKRAQHAYDRTQRLLKLKQEERAKRQELRLASGLTRAISAMLRAESRLLRQQHQTLQHQHTILKLEGNLARHDYIRLGPWLLSPLDSGEPNPGSDPCLPEMLNDRPPYGGRSDEQPPHLELA